MKCRHCHSEDLLSFIDLGSAPPSNAYLNRETLQRPEKWFPLRVVVCPNCWLVQTEDYAHFGELFSSDYAYFSSYSSTWLEHARQYVEGMCERFSLGNDSHVVEIAANDGYLLQYFKKRGVPCLGVEPTASTAAAARQSGIDIVEDFFGVRLAGVLSKGGHAADLMVANNVLAHVPDINDFVAGFAKLLKPAGVATFEFPHLLRLVADNQFDTIYHEHFSYLSLHAVRSVLATNGLQVFDAEELPTHGGSLRVYAQRSDTAQRAVMPGVSALLAKEQAVGMRSKAFYENFQQRADRVKNDFVAFLIEARRAGKSVAAYGAAAKGNTLLNYAGIRPDLLNFVVDRNPAKQGQFMPGSRIPIVDEQHLRQARPDYVVILPWNLRAEIVAQLAYIREWGGRFAWAIPTLTVES
jgi:2-polyprenyl-3-methyl-5-hydroxy-6-metoxy-1,4-benzoquinol methylase